MTTLTAKQERQDRILGELSELGLVLARDLQGRALAAEDVSTASELGLAFQRVARAVRQTLALEAKLERDRQRDAHDDSAMAEQAREAHAERRKAQVRVSVKRCVLYEYDGFDADNLLKDLDDRLEEDGLYDVFAGDDDIDRHIARLCEALGVSPPEIGEDTVEDAAPPRSSTSPSPDARDPSIDWQSSA